MTISQLASVKFLNDFRLPLIVSILQYKSLSLSNHLVCQYDDDIDGGIDGGRRKRKKKKAEVNIYDIYEPFDLEKGHFTMQDHEIKMTDLPER